MALEFKQGRQTFACSRSSCSRSYFFVFASQWGMDQPEELLGLQHLAWGSVQQLQANRAKAILDNQLEDTVRRPGRHLVLCELRSQLVPAAGEEGAFMPLPVIPKWHWPASCRLTKPSFMLWSCRATEALFTFSLLKSGASFSPPSLWQCSTLGRKHTNTHTWGVPLPGSDLWQPRTHPIARFFAGYCHI